MKRLVKFLLLLPNRIINKIVVHIPYFRFIKETRKTQTPISFQMWFRQKIIGYNRFPYWPVHFTSTISGSYKNIYCGIETSPGYSPGCYIQAIGKVYIGDYTQIAANVGIISANHDLYDNRKHIIKDIEIGSYCWLGMGALIMPGVKLGKYTIVGAGTIVTKSFEEGFCVIGGNPAKVIKRLDPKNCIFHQSPFEYNGYVPAQDFAAYRKKHLYI